MLFRSLSNARGEYCAILDADDAAAPERFEKQVQLLKGFEKAVLVGSSVLLIDGEGRQTGERHIDLEIQPHITFISHDQIAERNPLVHSSIMFRRNEAIRLGGYDEKFEYAHDFDLIQRLATVGELVCVQTPLTKYRVHMANVTYQRGTNYIRLENEMELFRLASERLDLTESGRKLNHRRQALCQLEMAVFQAKKLRLNKAMLYFLGTVRKDPTFSWVRYLWHNKPLRGVL